VGSSQVIDLAKVFPIAFCRLLSYNYVMMKFGSQFILALAFIAGFYLFPVGPVKALFEELFIGVGILAVVVFATR
jgi:hypothetical protein